MKVILMSKTTMAVEQYTGVTNIARTSTQVTVTYGPNPGDQAVREIADWNLYVIET